MDLPAAEPEEAFAGTMTGTIEVSSCTPDSSIDVVVSEPALMQAVEAGTSSTGLLESAATGSSPLPNVSPTIAVHVAGRPSNDESQSSKSKVSSEKSSSKEAPTGLARDQVRVLAYANGLEAPLLAAALPRAATMTSDGLPDYIRVSSDRLQAGGKCSGFRSRTKVRVGLNC